MRGIGIFGGSFNPIHKGHILAAQEAVRALALDRLLLIPAAQPPHKELALGTPDAQTRLEMTRLAAAPYAQMEVCDVELHRAGPSYTVDTLRYLHAQEPEAELYLLMGTDMFLTLHKWFEAQEICRLAVIAPMLRAADDGAQRDCIRTQTQYLQTQLQARVCPVGNSFVELSSTVVRRMLAFGCGESLVPETVYAHIAAHGLYFVGGVLRDLPFERLAAVSLSLAKPQRGPHIVGCAQTAEHLAKRWGADPQDAARAGILHDITKALEFTEQLQLCEKYDIILDDFERENNKLLHAMTGAQVAKHIFGENDAVVSAIRWHTTGKAGMTKLEKILYLADYIEPNRDFSGVAELRTLADSDLDAAMIRGLEMSVSQLEAQGRAVASDSVAALHGLRAERKQNLETI